MKSSCRKVTGLIEKKSLVGLSFKESIGLKIHLKMCKYCSAYNADSELMDKLFAKKASDKSEKMTLSDDVKRRIISSNGQSKS